MLTALVVLLILSASQALHIQRKYSIVSSRNRQNAVTKLCMTAALERPVDSKLFYSQKSLEELGLSSTMVELAQSLGIQKPSKIQAIAAFGISTGKPCIVADQTGSGKTLAYLFPTLQRMINERKQDKQALLSSSTSPFMVIMTPTAELAMQVSKVVKTLANGLKFRTACFTSASDLDAEKKKLRLGTDVLVSTPGRLLQLLQDQEVDLSQLKVMVLDEADVLLMDQSFPLTPIGQACNTRGTAGTGAASSTSSQKAPSVPRKGAAKNDAPGETISQTPAGTQFLFVTATLPDVVVKQITAEFPDVMTLSGPGLHRIAPSIEEVLVDCSGARDQARSSDHVQHNKRNALLHALDTSPAERTIVFCNTIDQCRRVENILQREDRSGKGRSVYSYHGAIDAQTREDNMAAFSKVLLTQSAVLISTDRASRGMDFNKAHVDHVILYDFPREPSEYIRRVGRTGRAGRSGKVTVLVYGKQLPAARAVMKSSADGKKIQPSDSL